MKSRALLINQTTGRKIHTRQEPIFHFSGLSDFSRQFRIHELHSADISVRRFLIIAPHFATVDHILNLEYFPRLHERPHDTPQHGLEVFEIDVVPCGPSDHANNKLRWRATVIYKPAKKIGFVGDSKFNKITDD